MGVAAAGRDSPGRNSGLRHAVVHLVGHVHLQHPAPAWRQHRSGDFPEGCGTTAGLWAGVERGAGAYSHNHY